MSKVCHVTGKKTQVGMNVSHSKRHTKRTFKPNLQKLKFHSDILTKDFSLAVSTSGLRTLIKHGGIDLYVMAKPNSKLTPEMLDIKKAVLKKMGPAPAETAKKSRALSNIRKPNRSARLIKKVEGKIEAKAVAK